jgi:hypothetical protein
VLQFLSTKYHWSCATSLLCSLDSRAYYQLL